MIRSWEDDPNWKSAADSIRHEADACYLCGLALPHQGMYSVLPKATARPFDNLVPACRTCAYRARFLPTLPPRNSMPRGRITPQGLRFCAPKPIWRHRPGIIQDSEAQWESFSRRSSAISSHLGSFD